MIAIMSDLSTVLDGLRCDTLRGAAGEALFQRGDPVRFLYRVRSGAAHLTRVDAGGRLAVMQRAGAGELLAEASLFSDTYHCDGALAQPGELARFRKADVLARLAAEPALLAALTAHLAREVQRTRARLEILARRTVAERLDAWLAFHDDGLPPAGQWRGVAEEIAVSPEALYRELTRRRA